MENHQRIAVNQEAMCQLQTSEQPLVTGQLQQHPSLEANQLCDPMVIQLSHLSMVPHFHNLWKYFVLITIKRICMV